MELLDIIKEYQKELVGIAHITGGGHIDNIQRILPNGLTFSMEKWELPPVFKWIQCESGMSYREMMRTYNCGYGMILIFNKNIDLYKNKNKYELIELGSVIKGDNPIFSNM